MSTTEIVLICVGGLLGYCLLGGLTAAVIAGISSARRDPGYLSYDRNKAFEPAVWGGGLLWPLVGLCVVAYFGGAPIWRLLARLWLRVVKRLNPNYAGTSI